jgi:outer membrane lipopolysaccharide assembly protein LptE/RlpB
MSPIRFVPSAVYTLTNLAAMLNLSIKGDAVINVIIAMSYRRVYVDNGKNNLMKENRNEYTFDELREKVKWLS